MGFCGFHLGLGVMGAVVKVLAVWQVLSLDLSIFIYKSEYKSKYVT